ncbi:MAG: hypothetical protein DCC52_19665 [Chloroflexi bacterium]|nr:MAG: hypothetical protein DCC52_19665 [Chloroflexota bacterium]
MQSSGGIKCDIKRNNKRVDAVRKTGAPSLQSRVHSRAVTLPICLRRRQNLAPRNARRAAPNRRRA